MSAGASRRDGIDRGPAPAHARIEPAAPFPGRMLEAFRIRPVLETPAVRKRIAAAIAARQDPVEAVREPRAAVRVKGQEASMGSAPEPDEPAPGRPENAPLTLGGIARTILFDRRLAHRYCMIAAGWKPDGSGDVRAAQRSPQYRTAMARLERAAGPGRMEKDGD